jgi:hypothetical protein
MYMKFAVAMIWLMSSSLVSAAPVFIECNIPNQGEPFPVEVTVDEQAGTVSLFMPTTGNRQKLSAIFSADRVTFGDRYAQYALSRSEPLYIVRIVPLIKSSEHGLCKMMNLPKRAF